MKRITGVTLKPHFLTDDVVSEVMNDLVGKYPDENCSVTDYLFKEVVWDPGGMMMVEDTTLKFDLGNVLLLCKAQFFQDFYFKVSACRQAGPRGITNKFYKIHGAYNCVCLNVNDFETLYNLVNDKSIQEQAALARQKRDKKLIELSEAGAVVQVIEGEDGKLYKVGPNKNLD